MNNDTQEFIERLKRRPEIVGIILLGSWARGNNRIDSDVDLVVIVTEGFRRTVEYNNAQAFEIIYTTEQSAFEFWESHKDDCASLWEVAKVLYDRDGTIERLQTKQAKAVGSANSRSGRALRFPLAKLASLDYPTLVEREEEKSIFSWKGEAQSNCSNA